MNIEVKYKNGDKVNWRIPQNGNSFITCPFCNGTKLVQGHDNSTLPCPKCEGRGEIRTVEYREGTSEITGVSVSYNSEDMKTYSNGPRISYFTTSGGVDERYILGLVSEN